LSVALKGKVSRTIVCLYLQQCCLCGYRAGKLGAFSLQPSSWKRLHMEYGNQRSTRRRSNRAVCQQLASDRYEQALSRLSTG
jgi:hypothetical protein